MNKGIQGIQTENTISGNYSASSIDIQSRTSIQPIPHKNFNKKQVPLKSATRGWRPPLGPNNDNLVIRFSDDDSGSDSEEQRLVNALETKGNTTVVDGNRRVPVPSLAKSNKLRQTARNENKVMPKKLSLSRMSTTPTTTIQGVNSRGAGPSLIDQGSRGRHFTTLNKHLGSRERGSDQNVGLNNTKLQDLRQQIALRESELKHKSAQQNKESSSVSCRDYNAMNQNNDAARKLNAAADSVQLEPKEPDKKRLKVSGSLSAQPSSGGQREMPAAKSTLPSKGPALESISLQDWNKADCSQRGISLSRAESSIVQWKRQGDKCVAVALESIPSRAKDGADINTGCNQSDRSSQQSSVELNNPSKTGGHQPPGYLLNKATAQDNLRGGSDHHEVILSHKTLEPSFKACQGPVNNGSLRNYLGNENVSENSNIKLQSLIEMEESLEKDLEEAQEHRHKCEIEERNALKAYRKAQRALIEANARCTDLYRRREHYSTHFRSYIIENSSLFCSSMQHEHVGVGLNYSNNISENANLIPTSSHHMQPEFDGSNIQCVNNAPSNATHWHVRGHSLGSEPCSEPDASTSEPLPHRRKSTAEGTWSPSNDLNPSADEDEETFAFELESVQPNIEYHMKEKNLENGQDDIINESNKKFLADNSQDTLLLEATLRSELFARLGTKTFSQNTGSCDNTEHAVERGPKNDFGREKTQIGNGTFSMAEKYKQSDLRGADRQKRSIFETPCEIQNQSQTEKISVNSHSTADSQDCGLSTRQDHHLPTSVSSSSLIFRSAFGHLKVMSPISLIELWTKNQLEDRACVNSDEIQRNNAIANTIKDLNGKESGSYTCSPAVDPFWPLCMYELRGKCNNDECPWQHSRDHSNGNMYQQQHDDSDSADSQQICSRATKGPKYLDVITSPTYLVGLDMLRADPCSYESVLARRSSQWWQKSFSIFLAVSKMLQKAFPADGPFLHGTGGRIEIHGNWNREASYFQSRNGVLNQLEQSSADNDQSLEMALIILNQEVNNLEGVKKALDVLSRALETDPTSVTLWIFYLIIYYSNAKSVGKDDMFSHAVKLNEGSYELWLIYINSRAQLDDRLVAYDSALKALCSRASDSDRDGMHASACILDLFLQMMGCLCMSGNVEKAIQRIYGLFPALTNSDEPHSLSPSDILVCLTLSDKCVFWVCCVYLVIYRKLPDAVVQRFECEKELLEIEWPCISLIDDEKQRALELVEAALDSVDSCIYTESQKSEINLRSAQLFAVNHIRCMVALDSLECVRNLLDKYIKLHPSCLELVLISAWTLKHDFGDLSFEGFEEALSQWRKEVPGVQCIWNQYVEYALQNGRLDVAKELLVHWFHSVWKVQYLQNGLVEPMDGGNSCHSLALASKPSPETLNFNLNQIDLMFGYLNLSLHKLLQNDHIEARAAIDKAMKAATPEYFKHCLREHATFLLTNESLSKEDPPIIGIKNVLEGYLDDAYSFLISEPLSRKFINDIKKSRVQQLVSNIFSPVSFDFSLVNSILEVWYGPSLLPQKFSDSKNLVDFVESILEILPSNYPLAISVCKLLSREYNSTNVTCASVLFWGSSTLVSAIFHAIPIPPEYVWVEAAGILGNLAGIEAICERFYKRAFSVYPFSVKLWKSYYNLSKAIGNASTVVEAAKEKGIELDEHQF
ncbi:hypothetical protein FH972_001507 [Carpinus fangiana]|uniref:Putative zinc-finger domain-containing protein n=1 Tax=Carpinus fangiana TaxID=176857 RepID=A0A5N6QC04_9ROSI|nr:hypothetical protein FH972_001507 [Carpinus fangiana]